MVNDVSTTWVALADSIRRQNINLLEEKPRTTNETSEYFDVSRFAIMKHLKVLEQAELIQIRRKGRQRWNFFIDDLAHFLRTKLANDDVDAPYRLVEILGLFPGCKSAVPLTSASKDFINEQSVLLKASPSQIFKALTTDVDAWWSQRIAPDSHVYLEPYVNGRFYEEGIPYQHNP